ncbi:hypothetical protein EK21DRAFT_117077 [Setomelanomma holmii]|uniref:Xylanolytic transcriptional activator regulatory domain-containing protein n=1 Tax=Setomelanomma holmii TaxID=210430 RepID=A0A9P4GYS7_9PLEO|nr:hypothetical protein EK21DRAFT_117077 [Setomelanomma holmii]
MLKGKDTDMYRAYNIAAKPAATHADLLAEIKALRALTDDLETRVAQSALISQIPIGGREVPNSPSAHKATDISNASLSDPKQLSDVVAHLQRLSRSATQASACSEYVVFRIAPIRTIPQSPRHTVQLGEPILCVWLPILAESKILVEHYIFSISHFQHILHSPSIPAIIDHVYQQIDAQEPLQPGYVILLLSLIASATHVWTPRDELPAERLLFSSFAQAHIQTPLWIKATNAVINASQNSDVSLETVQGIIILSFLVANLEGPSVRYRSLIASGLLLGRELGLHQIDNEAITKAEDTVTVEMGRRAWWYLVATDWLIAVMFNGPGEGVYQAHPLHMCVNKPRNINDNDIRDGSVPESQPLNQPTDMSYFLQRIHLAEISRSIVDHNIIIAASSQRLEYYSHVMTMDSELEQMRRSMPHFFELEEYAHDPENATSNIFLQAYMLNSLMHSQRCKLHLPYLTTGAKYNAKYTSSRDACLRSAKYIIYAETRLLESGHPSVQIRLRIAAILYGVFIASIVLLMDVCLYRPEAVDHEVQHGDLASALGIIDDMKSYSMAAAKLHESLMQIVAKYRSCGQQAQAAGLQSGTITHALAPRSNLDRSAGNTVVDNDDDYSLTTQPPRADDEQAHEFENSLYLDQSQWDDLFTGLAGSPFF